MGQDVSKKKLQQIKKTAKKINQADKITPDKIDKYFKVLQGYTDELEKKYKHLRGAEIYDEAEKLINEARDDLYAVTPNFLRGPSIRNTRNIKKSVKDIMNAVVEIKARIENEQITKRDYEILYNNLLEYLKQLVHLQKKSKGILEIKVTQDLVSSVIRELVTAKRNFETDKETLNSNDSKIVVEVSVGNSSNVMETENKLTKAQEEHYKFVKESHNFKETLDRDLYEKHKKGLRALRKSVNQISEANKKIAERKKYLIYNIDNSLALLEQKAKEKKIINLLNSSTLDNFSTKSEQEQEFMQKLNDFKEKVTVYTGIHKTVLYRDIEKGLNKCLCDVDLVFKDENIAREVEKDIKDNQIILKRKCNQDNVEEFNENSSTIKEIKQILARRESATLTPAEGAGISGNISSRAGNIKLAEIEEDIENVKRKLTNWNRLSHEELEKLDNKLILCVLKLDNIKDNQLTEETKKLYGEINLYSSRIQELIN